MASTYTLTSNSYDGRKLTLTCTQTKDTANNRSKISWTLKSSGGNSSYYSTGPTTVKIAGTTRYSKPRVDWSSKTFPAAAGSTSGEFYISHNNNGKKSVSVSLATAIYTSTTNTKSGTWTLDTIPRKATITSAPNFNDEESPKITYSNPAGSSVDALEACIANSSGTILIGYRSISKTGSSYTFNFTDAERTTLRKHIATGNSATVRFYVRTTIGDTKYTSYLSKTLSLINYTPTLSPTVSTYSQTQGFTGDTTTLIRYYSDAKIAFGAAARKNATLSSKKVTNSGKSRTTDGDITSVTSSSFTFTATDSRGYTTTVTKTLNLVPYIKPTCNLKVNIGVDGVATIDIDGSFYNGKFGNASGAKTNTITVKYRYKEANGTYTPWAEITPLMALADDNTYSAEETLSGLDYQKTYYFQAQATDTLTYSATTPEKKVKSMPVFDWGENDFHFHVPVSAPNLGRTVFNVDDCIDTSFTGKLTKDLINGYFYIIQPFNLVYFRLNINGFTGEITSSTTPFSSIRFNSKVIPAANTALSCYGQRDTNALIDTNGNLRLIPRDGFTTASVLCISGVYPLSANSELYI